MKRSTCASTPPSKRALHTFVYDEAGERLVIFGGFGTALLNDTWIGKVDGNTATWTKLTASPSPSKRYGQFSGFDAQTSRLIVYSGAQGTQPLNPAQDTWALDLSSEPPVWSLLLDGAAQGVPAGRRNGAAVFDPSGPRLFVFGGTADAMSSEEGLWALDARKGHEAWARVDRADEPPVRSSAFGLEDGAGNAGADAADHQDVGTRARVGHASGNAGGVIVALHMEEIRIP